MRHSEQVDAARSQRWVWVLHSLKGIDVLFQLARVLETPAGKRAPPASWSPSKWYRFANGHQVPRQDLLRRVERRVGGYAIQVHHPAWRLLRAPELSGPSVRRMVGNMPRDWRVQLKALTSIETKAITLGCPLLDRLGIRQVSFLDFLLMFAMARRDAVLRGDRAREARLVSILYSAPLLFVDEHLWAAHPPGCDGQWDEAAAELMRLIDRGLDLPGREMERICFPVQARLIAMVELRKRMASHLERHPRVLTTPSAVRGFLARQFQDSISGPSALAMHPFRRCENLAQPFSPARERPVDERLWVWGSGCLWREDALWPNGYGMLNEYWMANRDLTEY